MTARTLGLSLMALFVLAGFFRAAAGDEHYQGWQLTVDGSGNITAMTFNNPVTSLGIEATFSFTIDNNGIPSSGTIKMKNGLDRPMKPKEMDVDFAECGGPKSIWDYYKDHGKTVSFFPQTDKVPFNGFGKISRLILNNGQEFIGRLSKLSDKIYGYSLAVEGACCGPLQFYNNVVKEIQQMK
jgi:hypothetical protein